MIFVTVGTHEQQFNRLIKFMDDWATVHDEEVVIQSGYSTYKPSKAKSNKIYAYDEMKSYVKDARVVITHGGPSSFIAPLQIGKIPIVVPRRKEFGEHVNNHQVDFCNIVAERKKNIIVVNDLSELGTIIDNYQKIADNMLSNFSSNNDKFCVKFADEIRELMRDL